MSSSDDSITLAEAIALLAAGSGMLLWYAVPQAVYLLYPLYEYARLIWPTLVQGIFTGI